ncbi:MAG TPA: ATP-binding protein, partial [Flavisolibacter sp.]
LSIAVFRIFQEALTNVARHAKAAKVTCSLEKKGNRLYLTITDDGVGFTWQPQRECKTLGLLGLKERVAVLNGHFTLESRPGKGTVISVDIPIDE